MCPVDRRAGLRFPTVPRMTSDRPQQEPPKALAVVLAIVIGLAILTGIALLAS